MEGEGRIVWRRTRGEERCGRTLMRRYEGLHKEGKEDLYQFNRYRDTAKKDAQRGDKRYALKFANKRREHV